MKRILIIGGLILLVVVPLIFLYPPTWLEPDTRDNQSSFFADLESKLLVESGKEPIDYTSSYMEKIVPTLEDFRNTLNESQDIETIFFKFGDPHDDIGSGIHIYVYDLNDSTQIWIGYANHIMYVQHVDSDGNILEQLL